MAKFTSNDLFLWWLEDNKPIDYSWVNYQKRKYNNKDLLEICRDNIECYADDRFSKNQISRASKKMFDYLYR